LLRQNVDGLNRCVHVIASAVGNETGQIQFEDNLNHGALSRIHRFTATPENERSFWTQTNHVKVDVVTLDRFCAEHSDTAPTFVKLDVEGAGHLVLQGATAVLNRHKPAWSCSFHSPEERNGIIQSLSSHGYRGIQLTPGGSLSWCGLDETTEFGHPDSVRTAALIDRFVLSA